MAISLKESKACAEMASLLYRFLPGSGASHWKGHVSFRSVADEVGVGEYWGSGSKEPAIALLLERTLEYRRDVFEGLTLGIVRAGIRNCQKNGEPITASEIRKLNGLLLEVGFKFPTLWEEGFLVSLGTDSSTRAEEAVSQELDAKRIQSQGRHDWLQNLEGLKNRYYELGRYDDRQAAGRELEVLLNELFELSDLAPRKPFRVTGEQIDGSFELDNETYLIEAKWETEKLCEAPLLVFRGKIEGKSAFTRGVFISLNGFSGGALKAITHGKQPTFFLMDGYDLTIVLEGRMSLVDLLRAKLRKLTEEGDVHVSARKLLP